MYEVKDHQILKVEEVTTPNQVAIVRTFQSWLRHVHATYENDILRAEYRYPAIEGTEWQGQIIEDENRPMYLHYGDESIEIPVTNGVAEEQIEFPAPGTYQLRIDMGDGVGCEPAELEVTVDE